MQEYKITPIERLISVKSVITAFNAERQKGYYFVDFDKKPLKRAVFSLAFCTIFLYNGSHLRGFSPFGKEAIPWAN